MDFFKEKLLPAYRQSHDIKENFRIEDTYYDAYGFCNITNAKYVLVKKAELWRALNFEHVFFKTVDFLEADDIDGFRKQLKEYIEPNLVRKGGKTMEKDHMSTHVDCIFLCEKGITPDAAKVVKKVRFFKDYMLSIRGFCDLRVVAVDLAKGRVIGNSAARDLVKYYDKLI
ncbi:MAG: hypothetical protein IKK48_04460 [Firmicutes bacterium]|nr:hypothetical protein [Bacillota bacterium]